MTTGDRGNHRTVFFAALALAIASLAVFALLDWRAGRGAPPLPAAPRGAASSYAPSVEEPPAFPSEAWRPPVPLSRGREWVYDTFTPPEIFYNARTRQFTVRPPEAFVAKEPQPFGLELIAVRPELFPLQLIGYVGDEGHWRGTFENTITGDVFLATAGWRLPDLGLTIASLEVRPQPVASADSMTTRQRVATALIRDERNGTEVALTHRERKFTDAPIAVLLAAAATAPRELRAGDEFRAGDALYRIERVRSVPPAVEVSKQSLDGGLEQRTLTPREPQDGGHIATGGS